MGGKLCCHCSTGLNSSRCHIFSHQVQQMGTLDEGCKLLLFFNYSLPFQILLFCGSLYIFLIWIIGCITLNFQLVGITWSYDMTVVYNDILSPLELYFCSSSLILSFTSYIIILGSIYKKKRKFQNSFSVRAEIGILTQATVLTTYMTTTLVLWHNAEYWFKMTDITLALLNGLWILVTHLNALVLIATNRTVRNQFLSMIGKKSNRKISKIGGSPTVLVNKKISSVVS
ncbi:hypothetical protein CRE_15951 [Caenorhabditis remanei]|uniref:7TM GPCR serpentine receptor class x (Srx) domain-containing protein n=1 Tax=Caenorhabditis remanei TaxID=31234 RepID=E3MBR4_CAERE|nr:hypothetical protein CRE_15951 [Caenorhabditis remanei]